MTEEFDFEKPAGDAPIPHKLHISVLDVKNETEEQRKRRMLLQMQPLVQSCSLCPLGRQPCLEHDSKFDPHVFSTMNVSPWLICGQNPGFNECLEHEPFVGEAGRFFNEWIEKGGLSRSKFYITNCVLCHTLNNEPPTPEQIEMCSIFLKMEILILEPILVITLGAAPFSAFCPNLNYAASLGKIQESKRFNCQVFPIYHPSPRNMTNLDRLVKFKKDVKTLCKLIKAYELREG
jgi:DNA polymerase